MSFKLCSRAPRTTRRSATRAYSWVGGGGEASAAGNSKVNRRHRQSVPPRPSGRQPRAFRAPWLPETQLLRAVRPGAPALGPPDLLGGPDLCLLAGLVGAVGHLP